MVEMFQAVDRGRALGYARRLTRDSVVSEDLVQEAYLRVMNARMKDASKLRPYYFRVLTRLCLDELARRPLIALENVAEQQSDRSPEQGLLEEETRERILLELDALPWKHRMAVVLRIWEGMSFKDIGLSMDVTETNAATLVYRGFKTLKSLLSEESRS